MYILSLPLPDANIPSIIPLESKNNLEVLTLSTVVGCRLILNAVMFRGFGAFGFISLLSVFLTGTSPRDPVIK